MMREMIFTISPELEKLGVKIRFALFSNANIVNKVSELEIHKKEVEEIIYKTNISENDILYSYKQLHQISGVESFQPPAESLIELIHKNHKLPNINSVVDSYNIISAESFLSIGAHDLDKIKGNLALKFADGGEHYLPLGNTTLQKINKGEYICKDQEKVICWLDIKQCEETKITKNTKNYLIYIQGNANTSNDYLENAINKVIHNQEIYCEARFNGKF